MASAAWLLRDCAATGRRRRSRPPAVAGSGGPAAIEHLASFPIAYQITAAQILCTVMKILPPRAALVAPVRERGVVLDVACGYGRHARWFHQRNHPVVLVDRSPGSDGRHRRRHSPPPPARPWWPTLKPALAFRGRQFDAVVVTNYLWRPLLPTLLAAVAPGGVLIYETFTQGNETVASLPGRIFFAAHRRIAGNLPGAAGGGLRGGLP